MDTNLSQILFKPKKSPITTNVATRLNISYSFISLFNPSSIKNLTLYHRNFNNSNTSTNLRGSFRNYKILVKQSYLMSAWFYYYTRETLRSKKIKGFATLPCRQTRHTAAKAPMAHKTFSQEQFIIKYYFITFKTETREASTSSSNSLNRALLLSNIFLSLGSFSGTNMLILYKVKCWFLTSDNRYFNYFIKL
jgi:hypothetical protein